jgi:hypothetical protein
LPSAGEALARARDGTVVVLRDRVILRSGLREKQASANMAREHFPSARWSLELAGAPPIVTIGEPSAMR